MSWGKGIILSFILFATFIFVLVGICLRQDISLVTRDYYRDELEYQQQINRMNNANQLSHKPLITVTQKKNLVVYFDQLDQVTKGELIFFCPSDERLDRKFELLPGTEKTRTFELDLVPKGLYRAKLSWEMHDKEFYTEEVIFI